MADFASFVSWDCDQTRPFPSKWIPPPPGMFKVNVDGASSELENTSSVGVIIRDSKGQVVAALCMSLQSCYSVEVTEIIALEQCVLLAQELQLPRVIFESDSIVAIQAVSEKILGGTFGHFIQVILQACDSFETWFFKPLSRNFNAVAHELAQFSRRHGCSQV